MTQQKVMTSLERVLTTLGHKEPDRVPFFLLLTMHGAKELGMTIKEYFSKAENVVEGQIRLQEKYRHDCYYPFFYAPIEVEAWGGDVIFSEDGPPNAGAPIIKKNSDIQRLSAPDVNSSKCLNKVLDSIQTLKNKTGDDVPIIGVVVSPFSLPVMQMGFSRYLDLLIENPPLFKQLMQVNEEFCVAWANAQLQAGATAICYFDPISSPTITTRQMYLETGFKIAKQTLARINGPTVTHLASGISLPIMNELIETRTAAVGSSALEDLSELKQSSFGKITIIGNLNGIEMRRWTVEQTESIVKDALKKAGPGGGFILSDNHGEIPWQVPDRTLSAISDAVHKWGVYPLK